MLFIQMFTTVQDKGGFIEVGQGISAPVAR